MKRWTNGLPGATMRLGAKMAQRGLSVSQPRMRADTHVGPELNAPLQRPDTLMQLSRSSLSEIHLAQRGRAIHIGTKRTSAFSLTMSAPEGENGHAFSAGTLPSLTHNGNASFHLEMRGAASITVPRARSACFPQYRFSAVGSLSSGEATAASNRSAVAPEQSIARLGPAANRTAQQP